MKLTYDKLAKLEIGKSIHDMHYGILQLELADDVQVSEHTQWFASNGSSFIEANTEKCYTNKMLVLVGVNYYSEPEYIFNYSYDNRYFGVVVLKKGYVK